VSYGAGDFDGALRYYSQALKSTKEKADLHVERGRIFGMRAEADSAIAEFRQALTEQRKRDAKDVVVVYNSKAVLEQAIGVLLEQQDSVVGAREAYGRALQEDLAYWPAHVRLGQLAITLKDTATAVSELTLAAQIAPKEGYVRALVGSSLAMLGKVDEAVTELTKAIELEPYYAMPHVMLGRIYDQAGFHDEAAASYAQFLAHASRHDPQREFAEQRAAALKAATP
jgi:Flp pilus assembly protein TadD